MELRVHGVARWLVWTGCLAGCVAHSKPGATSDTVPLLVDAKLHPYAVVERVNGGRPHHDVNLLRRDLCVDRGTMGLVFYQLVMSGDWHYYWICGERSVRRAATAEGVRALEQWLAQLKSDAATHAVDCPPRSKARLFDRPHGSGVVASVFCDQVIMLRFPDGSSRRTSFSAHDRQAPSAPAAPAGYPATPAHDPATPAAYAATPAAYAAMPAAYAAPAARPAPTRSPTRDFWHGVKKACDAICPRVYQKCRELNPNTSLCHQMRSYCTELPGICARAAQ